MGSLLGILAREMQLELLLQLAIAVVLGGVIGLEREWRGKPAGLRTNILICLGSALFTHLSERISATHGDPGRVAAQILTGVGFIGAGTILHARGAVSGLTSAATIWVVAAIGMALGSGAYVEALGSTALVLIVLTGLLRIEAFVERHSSHSRLLIHTKPDPNMVEEIETLLRRAGLEVRQRESRRENVDLVVELEIRGPKRLHGQGLLAVLHHPGVRSVSTGE